MKLNRNYMLLTMNSIKKSRKREPYNRFPRHKSLAAGPVFSWSWEQVPP